jgi:hypothetical protein
MDAACAPAAAASASASVSVSATEGDSSPASVSSHASQKAAAAAKRKQAAAKHKTHKQAREAKARKEMHKREAAASAAAAAKAPQPQDEFAEDSELSDEDDESCDAHALDAHFSSWSDEARSACMESIVQFLRTRCSREGTSPGDSTSLFVPVGSAASAPDATTRHGTEEGSWFAGANAVTAFFLDDFLYSRDDFSRLIDDGTLQLFHCLRCNRVLAGDCRPKKPEDRQKEEAERRELIARMRRESNERLHEEAVRHALGKAPEAAADAASSATGSVAESSHPQPSVTSLANAFTLLATGDGDEATVASVSDADTLDVAAVLGAARVAAAQAEVARAIAELPAISPYLYPRNNAMPRQCRYCHAPSGQLAVRTHMTHSLSVRQMRDMCKHLINPHVNWSEGIGHAMGKKAKSAAAAASEDGIFAVDIGSRLGNLLYAGVLWSLRSPSDGGVRPRWLGVELDGWFASLAKRVLRRWRMSPEHAACVEGDITAPANAALLRGAKLVSFFNCFELHVTRDRHRELLRFLRASIAHRGQYILSCPSLVEIFERAGSEVDVHAWVQQVACKDDAFLFRVR